MKNKTSDKERCFGEGEKKVCIAKKGKDFLARVQITSGLMMALKLPT